MNFAFTVEQFLGVFTEYNQSVWPMQLVLYGVALGTAVLLWVPARVKFIDRLISAVLSVLWLLSYSPAGAWAFITAIATDHSQFASLVRGNRPFGRERAPKMKFQKIRAHAQTFSESVAISDSEGLFRV